MQSVQMWIFLKGLIHEECLHTALEVGRPEAAGLTGGVDVGVPVEGETILAHPVHEGGDTVSTHPVIETKQLSSLVFTKSVLFS